MTQSDGSRTRLVGHLLLLIVVVAVRWLLHEPTEMFPVLAPEIPDTWWSGLVGSHDWLLHGFDQGEWLALVNAYLDGSTSHVTRPPAYPLLAALLAKVVGHRVLALHLVGHIASVLVCLATYALGTRLASRSVGVGAALLVATAPRVVSVQNEIGAFPVLVLALLCLMSAAHATASRPTLSRGVWLGLAGGFCLSAHYTSAPFVLPGFLLVALFAGRRAFRPLLLATSIAVLFAGTLYATVPAQSVHSGQVDLVKFYTHALNHPDGRDLKIVPATGTGMRQKFPHRRPELLSSRGHIGRTFVKGPLAAARSMAEGYGPGSLAPVVVGLMLLGIVWPAKRERSGRLDRWKASLWLATGLGPLLYAAASLQGDPDHRYLSFSVPFAALAFARGVGQCGLWARRWVGPIMATGLAAVPLGLVLVGQTAAQLPAEVPPRHLQIQQHALAQEIRAHFGTGGTIVGPTGQMGPIASYAALARRDVCSLGSGGGTCLDGHALRGSLAECVQALLDHCVDGEATPYVLDLFHLGHPLDKQTTALHDALQERLQPTLSQQAHERVIVVYALDPASLRALAADVR